MPAGQGWRRIAGRPATAGAEAPSSYPAAQQGRARPRAAGQIPAFGAFRISRRPSSVIAPAAIRSTHFFARR